MNTLLPLFIVYIIIIFLIHSFYKYFNDLYSFRSHILLYRIFNSVLFPVCFLQTDQIIIHPLYSFSPFSIFIRIPHFRLICDKNGLKHIRFHDLLHSCASLLYDGGVDIKGIQDWIGHSSVSTTANIYTYLNYKTKITSANILTGTILGKSSGFEELFLPVKKESDPAAN